jgi:hypothetical protein
MNTKAWIKGPDQRMNHGWLALGHGDKQEYVCEMKVQDGVD